MANLISYRETFDGRDGGIDSKFNHEYTRTFVVELDSPPAGPETATALAVDAGAPNVLDVYQGADGSVDFRSFCSGLSAKQFGAPWIWQITAKYTGDIDLSNPTGDPLLMPPSFKWGSKTATKPLERAFSSPTFAGQLAAAKTAVSNATVVFQAASWAVSQTNNPADYNAAVAVEAQALTDLDAAEAALAALQAGQGGGNAAEGGVAVRNSAGTPFDPPAVIEQSWLTLTITRNLTVFDPVAVLGFINRTNLDAWLGFQPGEVICRGLSGDSTYDKGEVYWTVTGQFEIKPNSTAKAADAWAIKLLDRGYISVGADGKPNIIKEPFGGRPMPTSTLLDGNGGVLPRTALPVFLSFIAYNGATFADLPIP